MEHPKPMTVSQRFQGDKLTNDYTDWQLALNLSIPGENPSDILGLSFYNYGAMIYFSHPSRQLEFHCLRSEHYAACFTIVCDDKYNQAQVREPFDRNSITFTYPLQGNPSISTEFPNTNLMINPKGDLILKPDGKIILESPISVPHAKFVPKTKDEEAHVEMVVDGHVVKLALLQ